MTLLDSHRELLEEITKIRNRFGEMQRLTEMIQRAEAAQKATEPPDNYGKSLPGTLKKCAAMAEEKGLNWFAQVMRESIAEIERLQALVPRWRKLDDPELAHHESVLILIRESRVVFECGVYRNKKTGTIEFHDDSGPSVGFGAVESWQPLPAPPQPEER